MIFDPKQGYERWDVIYLLSKENSYKKLAEIGVDQGFNAQKILDYPDLNLEHLFLVDPSIFQSFFSWVLENKKPASFLKMLSTEAAAMFKDQSLDLVFIDADHTYESARDDIKAWLPKIKKGGIICGHDYGGPENMFPGVKQAVDEIFATKVNSVPVTRVEVWWVQV